MLARMRRGLQSRARRHGRVTLLLVASACVDGAGGSGGCSSPTPLDGALGQGNFTYVCPAGDATDPSLPSADAHCAESSDPTIPPVAVGAPFQLQVNQGSSGAPQPAVASLAQSTPQGWSITQPGWLGFVAWSGSDVLDFTHVGAEPVAALRFDSRAPTGPVPVGATLTLGVLPIAADGSVLGGVLACTFVASDPGVLAVSSTGNRFARVTARAVGAARLTASCLGAQAQIALVVAASDALDGGPGDAAGAGDDAGAGGDAGDSAPEGPADAGETAVPDSAEDSGVDAPSVDAADAATEGGD
jgi:hypothetical protein